MIQTNTNPLILEPNASVRLPTSYGPFQLNLYVDPLNGKEHLALIAGKVRDQENVLVRLHSECLTGDIFHSLRCDCGPQLEHGLQQIGASRAGVLLYLRQEGRGIGLFEKLKAYTLQDQGYDTVEANELLGHEPDSRDYSLAQRILEGLGVKSIHLITNNPDKVAALGSGSIPVTARITSPLSIQDENRKYLQTKAEKLRHLFEVKLLEG
jgi:GTP cyclohydrolase II